MASAQSEPAAAYEGPRRLGSEHGLPHNAVHALAQDRAGYLWVGTQDGLSRFDGERFVTFRAEPAQAGALASSFVTALLVDTRDVLWVGTVAGLHRARADGGFERIALQQRGAAQPRITALAVDADARVWIGSDAGLFVTSAGDAEADAGEGPHRFRHVPDAPDGVAMSLAPQPIDLAGLAPRRVYLAGADAAESDDIAPVVDSLHPAAGGGIWALVHDSASRLLRLAADGRVLASYPAPAGLRDFLPEPDGLIWIDARGPMRPGPDGFTPPPTGIRSHPPQVPAVGPEGGNHDIYRSFLRDHAGGVWTGTLFGVLHAAGDAVSRLSSSDGARRLTDEVTSLLHDRAGDLWVGTYGGLLHWHAPDDAVRTLAGSAEGLTGVSSIAAADDGALWVGTYGDGVAEVSLPDGTIRKRLPSSSKGAAGGCSDYVWEVVRLYDRVWAATSDGLCRVTPDGLQELALPRDLGPGFMLLAAAGDTLVTATPEALYRLDPEAATAERLAQLPAVPSAMLVEPDGTIWIGTELEDGSLLRVRGDDTEQWPALAPSGIWDIHRDRRGVLLLATGEGLLAFDDRSGELRALPSPVDASVSYSIAEDDLGRLWVGTHRGLVSYARDHADGWEFTLHEGRGGIGSVEYNRHGTYRLADGRLLLAGMHGITLVDPRKVADTAAPPPALHGIRIAGRGRDRVLHPRSLERVTLQPTDHAVTFEVGAIDLTGRRGGRYEYRLAGLEDEWTDGGARPAARYTTVPPGDYVFEARPSGGGDELRVEVAVLPPFWATWWFRALVLGTLLALVAVAYRTRVRHLLAMEQMRLRIADDLHDELGSELSGIALMSGVMARREALPPADRGRLTEIESVSREVAEGLRDIVWYTKPENDTVAALAARMRLLGSRLLDGIDHTIDLPEQHDRALDMRVRRDLYLAFKELVHNAVRHAEPSRVSISLAVDDGALELEIVDDGRGFDPESPDGGNGLASLRRRARQLGAELDIASAPGRGTRARLRVPGDAAG